MMRKAEESRFTDANGDYKTEGSFRTFPLRKFISRRQMRQAVM